MRKKRHKPLIGKASSFFNLKRMSPLKSPPTSHGFYGFSIFLCYFCSFFKKYSTTRVYCAELVLIV